MSLGYIQNQILTKLLKSDKGLRYSEARPKDVDDDLFNYHLKFLVEKGLVKKAENLYSLSDQGKKYVLQLDTTGKFHDNFKFSVLSYVTKGEGEDKGILLHKRLRQLYFGDIVTVSGKVLFGETVEDAASRKLKEETGLICDNFKLIGVHRKLRESPAGKLIEDTLYHCCVGSNPSGELIEKSEYGENFWASFKDAFKFQEKNIVASLKTAEILERIENNNFELFYFHEKITLPKY